MKKRYSKYIQPIGVIANLLIINLVILFIADKNYLNPVFLTYINSLWLLISYLTSFYKVHRPTNIFKLLSQTVIQFSVFFLAYFAYFGIFKEGKIVDNQLLVFVSIFAGITLFKLLYFYALKIYRSGGLNFRRVVMIGIDSNSKRVVDMFFKRTDLGYKYYGFFSSQLYDSSSYLGTIKESYDYIEKHSIDEIYCSLTSLEKSEIKELTKFANANQVTIKLIPEADELYSKNMSAEYHNSTLVFNVKRLPLELRENRFFKRLFDILFSLLIIVFLMSWLIPVLGILIVLDSKGPVFFKQIRRGLKGKNFVCYKLRSMRINEESDMLHTSQNDVRVTFIGKFLRKTSLDELPQFFNVLKGEMSVVGPRPHMRKQSLQFEEDVENYILRNDIRPGITGLAQTRGYRGEIIKRSDIENRVRLDIFYIENWSFFLDIKIILETLINIIKGERKAY